jgi:hypothetical protein
MLKAWGEISTRSPSLTVSKWGEVVGR